MSKHRDVKGTFKTEAEKGNVEYKPVLTSWPGVSIDPKFEEAWDKQYREDQLTRILAFKAIDGLKYESFRTAVSFNNDLSNPTWSWDETVLNNLDTWRLRDLALLLERKNKV